MLSSKIHPPFNRSSWNNLLKYHYFVTRISSKLILSAFPCTQRHHLFAHFTFCYPANLDACFRLLPEPRIDLVRTTAWHSGIASASFAATQLIYGAKLATNELNFDVNPTQLSPSQLPYWLGPILSWHPAPLLAASQSASAHPNTSMASN